MDFSYIGFNILIGTIYAAPWVVSVILAVRMLRRSGGRAERFLLSGASLMLASSVFATVVDVFRPQLINWLVETRHDLSFAEQGLIFSIIGAVRALITLAGISFLVHAFWTKFHAKT